MDNWTFEKMEDQKEEALNKLLMILPKNNNINDIATCIGYAFLDGLPSAKTLAVEADLNLLDFYAILNDYKRFSDRYEWIEFLEKGYESLFEESRHERCGY